MRGIMRAAIIGASAESIHTIKTAQKLGVEVTALDGDAEAAGLKAADNSYVTDIRDTEAVLERLKLIQPSFMLTAPIGRFLTATGAANDALHLKGVSLKATELCTDKWEFHETLSRAGLRNCPCFLIAADMWRPDAGQAQRMNALITSITDNIHYPAIIKPRYGSGSRGITVAENWEEVQTEFGALSMHAKEDYIIEDMMPGVEYGVDGAVTGGKFHLILLRRKINTPLPAREAVAYISVRQGELTQRVESYLARAVSTLGIDNSLIHCDLMISDEAGDPFIIELSARPSGHNLHNLFTPLATGVDEAQEMILFQCGDKYEFTPREVRIMEIRYLDFTGTAVKVPTEDEARQKAAENGCSLEQWKCAIHEGDDMAAPSTGHILMSRGYMILGPGDDGDVLTQDEAGAKLENTAGKILSLFEIR